MKELTLQAVTKNLPKVAEFINRELEALACPLKARTQVDVVIDELFANIASYAYTPGTGEVTVRFAFDASSRRVELVFIDRGRPFDPLAGADPDVTLPAEERQTGGLGIFLVKKLMDSVEYQYRDGQNILTVRKQIDTR